MTTSAKYLMLECNRLRSKNQEGSITQPVDEYKNRWTNTISSSGIRVNTGDVINVQQSIINTQGASDEVIEFTGDPNAQGFVDNKTQLTFSYYVNHTGRNTFAMPSLYHRCFNGIGTILDPTLNNRHPVTNEFTIQTNNHEASVFFMRSMVACRSLGEMLFAPLKVDGGNLVFEGGATTSTNRFNGLFYPNYFNANYLFRISVSQTGFGTSNTTGYFPNRVYPVRRLKKGTGYTPQNLTGGAIGDTTFECDYIRQVFADATDPTGYRVKNAAANRTFGTIQSITNDRVRMTITLTAKLTVDLPAKMTTGSEGVLLVPDAPAPANDLGVETGLRIRVLETTGIATTPNAITKFEIAELDVDEPNPITKGDTLIMTMDFGGNPLNLPDGNQQQFRVESTLDQGGFCSAQIDGVDGARYTLVNEGYTGIADVNGANSGVASDDFDFQTMNNLLDKRTTSIDLEMQPSFATPDNVGTILTDQMTAPKKLSNADPTDDFFNLTGTDYTFKQTQPRGALLDPVNNLLPFNSRNQSSDTIKPLPKPAVVSTPTYKPVVPNMYGKGIPDVEFNGVKRNGDQATFGGLRRMFYSSIAYKDMDRVVGLKHAFYDFNYPFSADGGTINYGRDIYPYSAKEEFESREASQRTFGDFGNEPQGQLGHRVCLLSKIADNGVVQTLPKNSLLVTNMKFNRSNISRISKGFRRVEKYIGDLSQKVDTSSADFKQKVAVNLDLGMYSDEFSTNGRLQVYTGNVDPPPANQRRRYGTVFESRSGLIIDSIPPVDLVSSFCQGFQRDFNNLANDSQELSSMWVKSRWQEGYVYENAKHRIDGYTGDYVSDPTAFVERQKEAVYYATDFEPQAIINEPADPAEDLKFIIMSLPDHTTILPPDASATADYPFIQAFAVGQQVVITEGTIDGQDATGRTATIEALDLNHALPSTTRVRQITLAGAGFGSRATAGMDGVTIKIVKSVGEGEFFNGTYTTDGVNNLTQEDAYNLSREFDVACVPVFQRIADPNRKISGWIQGDDVPLIAFVSAYQLGAKDPATFDFVNLGNDANLWQVDNYNARQGFQFGFDPSFTRNKAVAICNTQYGNLNEDRNLINPDPDAPKKAFVNLMYVGAVAPQLEFNSELSRFEFSGLNTPFTVGNGLPTDLPNNLIANPTPEQQVYAINKQGRIYPAQAKMVGVIAPVVTGTRNPIYDQFTSVQKHGTIMDSQSGLAIEGITLFNNLGVATAIEPSDTEKFKDTMLFKMGFDLNQLLVEIGDPQNFFINNFIFQDVFTYEKTLKDFIKPQTTGAFISSAEIQAISLNAKSMPLFDLGTETCILEATPDATQGAITAFRLPAKLDFPYLVVYSSITGGSCDTHFVGGSDSKSLLPAVAYLTRNENNGDYFYGLESDITFTAVKNFTLTDVEIDIRTPSGKRPRLQEHSAVIFKITKPLAVPNPELILNPKANK